MSEKAYANREDFRRVFVEHLDSFYQLCFLLTSDPEKAEQSLVAGFDDCLKSHHVFRWWAQPWAKRTLVQNAVRALHPCPDRAQPSRPANASSREATQGEKVAHFDFAAVLSLQDFERFVFVLSVLDEYSDRDCAILLGCFAKDVRNARTRAVQQLATSNFLGRPNAVRVNQKS